MRFSNATISACGTGATIVHRCIHRSNLQTADIHGDADWAGDAVIVLTLTCKPWSLILLRAKMGSGSY